jgi:hypothetical protein
MFWKDKGGRNGGEERNISPPYAGNGRKGSEL